MEIKLNLGCGNDIQKNYINHDLRQHRPEIDICFDLNEKVWKNESWWVMNVNSFDEIRAFDVIEHIDDPINFMDNCWQLLKPNGILYIKACGWQNPNFWVDITHKKGYDIKSFDYFSDDTEIGREYGYYTTKRWKFVESPKYDKRKNILVKMSPVK